MGRKLLTHPENAFSRQNFELFDDFTSFTDADQWTLANGTNGTVTHPAGRSNIRLFSTTDNDTATLATTQEIFKFTANQPMYGECRGIFADTATFNTAIAFGWVDAMAATTIAAGGAGMTMTNDGAMIWVGSESDATAGILYQFTTQIGGGTAVNSISNLAPQSTSAQTLKIDVVPRSSTVFELRPFVDDTQLIDNTSGLPIMHTITLGTATDMDFGVTLRGGHADDTTWLVDYLYASQSRT